MPVPNVVLVTDAADALPARMGIRVATRMWHLRGAVVHARVPVEALGRVALFATLAGARAVVAAPIGPARPLPWWARRFHRFVLPTQEAAMAWKAAGIHLGRLCVAPPGEHEPEALRAIWAEVASMATRAS